MERTKAIPSLQTVFFHSLIRDGHCVVIVEVVGGEEEVLGWAAIRIPGAHTGPAFGGQGGIERYECPSCISIQESHSLVFHRWEETDLLGGSAKSLLLGQSGTSRSKTGLLQYRLQPHPRLHRVLNFLPDATIVGLRERIPGLQVWRGQHPAYIGKCSEPILGEANRGPFEVGGGSERCPRGRDLSRAELRHWTRGHRSFRRWPEKGPNAAETKKVSERGRVLALALL